MQKIQNKIDTIKEDKKISGAISIDEVLNAVQKMYRIILLKSFVKFKTKLLYSNN